MNIKPLQLKDLGKRNVEVYCLHTNKNVIYIDDIIHRRSASIEIL
jgi:hypothetical protein